METDGWMETMITTRSDCGCPSGSIGILAPLFKCTEFVVISFFYVQPSSLRKLPLFYRQKLFFHLRLLDNEAIGTLPPITLFSTKG